MSYKTYFIISSSWNYVSEVVDEIGVLPSIWTVEPEKLMEIKERFPKCNVINSHDLTCGDVSSIERIIRTKIDLEPLSPLFQETYARERFLVLENLLHRSDPGGNYTHYEMRHSVNNYFIIAFNLLESFKPKLIYFEVPPHTMYDLALYFLAVKRSIKIIMGFDTLVPGYSIFLRKINEKGAFFNFDDVLTVGDEQKEKSFDSVVSNLREYTPSYMGADDKSRSVFGVVCEFLKYSLKIVSRLSQQFNYFKLKEIIRSISTLEPKSVPLRRGYRKRKSKFQAEAVSGHFDVFKHWCGNVILERFYNNFVSNEQISALENINYVYVPLALQIEMTTMPAAGFMYDQLCYIRLVCASLPKNWKVVVKENPKQWTHLTGVPARNKHFYSTLDKLGVLFAPIDMSSKALIKNSRVVALTTGSAGFEALYGFQKPVLAFAETWYTDCPGVKKINTFEDCRNALASLEADQWVVSKDELNRFIPILKSRGVYWLGEGPLISLNDLSEELIIKNIAAAIMSDLNDSQYHKLV